MKLIFDPDLMTAQTYAIGIGDTLREVLAEQFAKNTGVGSLSLLHGIFPIQRSNPGLPHCGQILYQLSHKETPRISKW